MAVRLIAGLLAGCAAAFWATTAAAEETAPAATPQSVRAAAVPEIPPLEPAEEGMTLKPDTATWKDEHIIRPLGETFVLRDPEGYCCLSSAIDTDRAFLAYMEKAAGHSVKFMHASAPCGELERLHQGEISTLKRFAAVALIGIDRKFIKFYLGNRIYITLIKAFKPKNFAKTEKRANKRLAPYGDTVSNLGVKVGSEDGQIIFSGWGLVAHPNGTLDSVRLLGGSKLVKLVPLASFIYDVQTGVNDDSDEQLLQLALPVLQSIEVYKSPNK